MQAPSFLSVPPKSGILKERNEPFKTNKGGDNVHRLWVEIDSGRVYRKSEMIRILESVYDFDECTPWSEIYDYFVPLKEASNYDIV